MIELSTVIQQLRRELGAAVDAAASERLRFELGPIELEVTVAVTEEGGAQGKVKFWVVELGGDLKDTHATTQRIKLTLQPTVAGSSEPPHVSGTAGAGER
ncbi:trypco2 family protein [Actinomadura miaoliensis]|uniref:Trypsin-co-occurring domain-containing protein n=1 Tax=Actinomadura miaoliensis TaxID=430685 RepID=A0ABP7X6S4_9ACTN